MRIKNTVKCMIIFAFSFTMYCSVSLNLRKSRGGSLASTYKLSTGDRKTPRLTTSSRFIYNTTVIQLGSDKRAIKIEKNNFINTSFIVCDDFYDIESLCKFFFKHFNMRYIKKFIILNTTPKISSFSNLISFLSKCKQGSLWGLRSVQKWT